MVEDPVTELAVPGAQCAMTVVLRCDQGRGTAMGNTVTLLHCGFRSVTPQLQLALADGESVVAQPDQ